MSTRKSSLVLLLILIAGLLAAGCSNSNNDNVVNATSDASIEFVHASSQTPAIDILIDSVPWESDLYYPHHTVYTDIAPGTHNVVVRLSGTSAPDYIDTNITFGDNLFYSLYVTDTIGSLKFVVMPDELSRPDSNYVHVRLVNLVPDKGPVTIFTFPGDSLFASMTGVDYKHYTSPVQINMGTYSLQVRNQSGDPLTSSNQPFDFTSGSNYTLMLIVPPGPGSGVVLDTIVTK